MARVNIMTAVTNPTSPKPMKRIGMCMIEVIDNGFPKTIERYLERESITEKELSLQLLANALTILKRLNIEFEEVGIYSDCKYIESAFNNKWLDGWTESDWMNAKGKEVANKDLWKMIWELLTAIGKRYILPEDKSSYENWMHNQLDLVVKNGYKR